MLNKVFLLLFVFLNWQSVCSQTLKWSNGVSISSMHQTDYYNVLRDQLVTYATFLGCDYWEHRFFYLSSEFGYINIGGKENQAFHQGLPVDLSESWNYIHLNTTFRLKYPFKFAQIYVGGGPKLDILAGSGDFEGAFFENRPDYHMNRLSFGGKIDAGVTKDFAKLRIGLNASYLLNWGDVGNGKVLSFYRDVFFLTASVGYKL